MIDMHTLILGEQGATVYIQWWPYVTIRASVWYVQVLRGLPSAAACTICFDQQ